MSVTEAKIKLTFAFADDTTRNIEISPLDRNSDAMLELEDNLEAFNVEPIKDILISDNGASCTGIISAAAIVTTDTEIDLK